MALEGLPGEGLGPLPVLPGEGEDELVGVVEAHDRDLTPHGQGPELLQDRRVPLGHHVEHVGLELDVGAPAGVLEEEVEDRLEALDDDLVLDRLGVDLPGRDGRRGGEEAEEASCDVLDVEVEDGQRELPRGLLGAGRAKEEPDRHQGRGDGTGERGAAHRRIVPDRRRGRQAGGFTKVRREGDQGA